MQVLTAYSQTLFVGSAPKVRKREDLLVDSVIPFSGNGSRAQRQGPISSLDNKGKFAPLGTERSECPHLLPH